MPIPKKNESERFKGPVKYAEYLFARALIFLLQRLPIRLAYRLGCAVGWLAWKLIPRRRATVRKNLEVVNAWMDVRSERKPQIDSPSAIAHPPSAIELQVREVFIRAGANLFSGFTFNRMSPEQAARHVEIDGIEHLKAALAEGKGVIVLLAHMGPWEALTQLPGMARQQYSIEAPFGAMYRPLNNSYLDDWYRRQREAQGSRLFSRRDGFHKPVDYLRAGGMLGILSDQKMREGPRASYFGVEVPSTPIPGLFHRRSGAPLCAVSLKTITPTHWHLRLRRVCIAPETDLSSREAMACICNQALAESLSESPLDGFWLHDRF